MIELRQQLLTVFARWGKPGAMRVDNGLPLGSPTAQSTPVFARWLIGIDVDMIWNKPARPQQNGRVEKMQDTTARWAEIERASSLERLQADLDTALLTHRRDYPVVRLGGKTRLEVYPQLEISRRIYTATDFRIERVYGFLQGKLYTRRVSSRGQISHYGKVYSVGMAHAHQWVQLRLSSDGQMWEVLADQQIIRRLEAPILQAENIQNLTVCQRM